MNMDIIYFNIMNQINAASAKVESTEEVEEVSLPFQDEPQKDFPNVEPWQPEEIEENAEAEEIKTEAKKIVISVLNDEFTDSVLSIDDVLHKQYDSIMDLKEAVDEYYSMYDLTTIFKEDARGNYEGKKYCGSYPMDILSVLYTKIFRARKIDTLITAVKEFNVRLNITKAKIDHIAEIRKAAYRIANDKTYYKLFKHLLKNKTKHERDYMCMAINKIGQKYNPITKKIKSIDIYDACEGLANDYKAINLLGVIDEYIKILKNYENSYYIKTA